MKLNNLLQNPLNRKIDRAKVADIKRAINASGVIKPLVYTEVMTDKGKENMLTDGHHRYVALKEMGYKDAPAVMSDERGIETAQSQDMRAVKKAITVLRGLSKHLNESINKAKKPCREGYYRDKDGNCRRRGQRYYGGGILVFRPRQKKPKPDNGNGTGNGSTPPSNGSTTQKHLQGRHDERTHGRRGRSAIAREWERKPRTRREAHLRGGVKGGAVHLGTIAIPALATAAIIRGAAALRFGIIGAGVALIIYEAPQFAFRVIEGSVREESELERRRGLKKAADRTDRTIKRGDHLLVLYKGRGNIGVYLGNEKVRLLNGRKFVDVRTTRNNRLKIASGRGVPSVGSINITRRILRQIKREQRLINQLARRLRTNKVSKHTPGGQQHDQQTHGRRGKGAVDKTKLRPAFRTPKGKIIAGTRGQIHADILNERPEIMDEGYPESGFVDENANFMTRAEAQAKVGISTTEELKEEDELKTFQGVKNHLSQGTKVILSAEKAGLKPDVNRRRSIRLKRILQRNSKDVITQSWHEGKNPIEQSYIVTPNNTKSLNDIIRLAFDPGKLNQESIIVVRNGSAEARYQDKRPSLRTTVREIREVPSAKGYYSQVGNVRYVFDFKPIKKTVIKDENRVRMAPKTLAQVSQGRLAKLRDFASTLNRMHKEITTADVAGLGLVREDLQDEMAHPHPGRVKKHLMGEHDQLTHGRRSDGAVRSSVNVPNKSAVKAAQRYVAKAGLTRLMRHEPVKVDKDRARRIADAYDSMEHDPNNPEVKAAYKAMADEVAEQYKILPVRIQYTEGDPYSNSEDMRRDVRENNRLKIFTGGESHPLLGMKGQDGVTVNDNFRAVHDYFGHAMRGFQFGPSGEENAWIEHSKMFSPLAQQAMTTETRGQNSWYNFSKENERRKPKDRKFARQKMGILPDEFLPKRARRMTRKGWATRGRFRLSQKMDMDEGVDTKNPYKNPDGAGIESARYP